MSAKHCRMSHNRDYVGAPVSSFSRSDGDLFVYLVCILDRRSRLYPHPFAFSSLDIAKREIAYRAKYERDASGKPPIFAEFPDDFALVLVGRFDVRGGVVHPCSELVCEVSDILS